MHKLLKDQKYRILDYPWQRTLLCAAAVTVASMVFMNFSLENFRISFSVVLLPVLLLTLNAECSPFLSCMCTSFMILAVRTVFSAIGSMSFLQALWIHIPAASFYLFYGLLFPFMVSMRAARIPRIADVIAFVGCDLLSNLLEVILDYLFRFPGYTPRLLSTLVLVAVARGLGASLLLSLYCEYHSLLNRADHEERYQRLYLMKTHLKGELYFLSKDKARIEQSVKAAYQLHSRLSSMPNVPREACDLALQIACDIHDLKKDYIRIEQGFHEELGENGQDRVMDFSSVLHILEGSTRRMLGDSPIRLRFSCRSNFTTVEHYSLMSILRCLVNNAIESLQSGSGSGYVEVSEFRQGEDICIVVADNGPGISAKNLGTIFQMGFSTKFDPSTGNLYRGMGLPNVKLVTQELGGTVSVTSEQGLRTEFTVRIPAAILEVPTL